MHDRLWVVLNALQDLFPEFQRTEGHIGSPDAFYLLLHACQQKEIECSLHNIMNFVNVFF